MPHTYRDESPDSRFADALGYVFCAVIVGASIAVVIVHAGADRLTWGHSVFVGLALVAAWGGYKGHRYGICKEIRLSDDGRCEFDMKRVTIRLHVNQIDSVKHQKNEDGDVSFAIRYAGGKIVVDDGMLDFHDFLMRLKTLNPVVKLSGFRPETWPGLGAAGTTGSRAGVVFPAVVVLGLVWLALHTITGN